MFLRSAHQLRRARSSGLSGLQIAAPTVRWRSLQQQAGIFLQPGCVSCFSTCRVVAPACPRLTALQYSKKSVTAATSAEALPLKQLRLFSVKPTSVGSASGRIEEPAASDVSELKMFATVDGQPRTQAQPVEKQAAKKRVARGSTVNSKSLADVGLSSGASILDPHAAIEDVMAEVQPVAKAAIETAAAHRAVVSKLEILKILRVGMSAADARAAGVDVLREEGGVMTVGAFTVPRLDRCILQPPRTFDNLTETGETLLLLPQRIELALELVDAVVAGRPLGIHLSGPDGTGKTAVLLLAYLILVARGIPVVFMTQTAGWVAALQADPSCGDAYFLKRLWQQNADLIVKSPTLREVFADVLTDTPQPFGVTCMPQLRRKLADVLHKRKDSSDSDSDSEPPGIAVLLDEAQRITTAALHAEGLFDDARGRAGQYFARTWFTWDNGNRVFQRLSAASAHAERDSNLPAGERYRLRFMEPLADADRDALLASRASPAYVRSEEARKQVVYAAGSVLRPLVTAARLLPAEGEVTEARLRAVWDEAWELKVRWGQRWLESLPSDAQRQDAADSVMSLLKGEQCWGGALVLYDKGIVCRSADPTTSEVRVRPVSAVANAVLLRVTSDFQQCHRKRLSTIEDASARGKEFKKQVLSGLDGFQALLPCRRLNGDGTGAGAVFVSSSYSLPFDGLEEVVPRDRGVLYRPFYPNYPCDGIIMYVDEHGKLRIIIVECSMDDPCEEARAKKVDGWFNFKLKADADADANADADVDADCRRRAGAAGAAGAESDESDGLVRKLQNMYPGAHISILLFFPKELMKRPGAAMTPYGERLYVHDPLPQLPLPLAGPTNAASAGGAEGGAPAAAASVADIRVVDAGILRTCLDVLF